MFIDIHVHAFRHSGINRNGAPVFSTPEQLIERYDEAAIEKGIVLPLVSPEVYEAQSTNEVLELCAEFPDRLIPFCNIDPRAVSNSPDADMGFLFEHYIRRGCKGVGEVTANIPFLDPKMQNLFRHAESFGLPLTFHIAARMGGMYGIYDDAGLPQLERSLEAFPGLVFLGHSQTFWAEIGTLRQETDRGGYPSYGIDEDGAVPRLMRDYPNLYGDLSAGSGCNALKRDRGYAVRFLEEFQDRLLFGTDICAPTTPLPLVEFLLDLRVSGEISEDVFQKVAHRNARKLLGIGI